MDQNVIDSVNSTFKKWNSTQAYLKDAELITEAAPIAAINELRYAGRIFVAAALKARDLSDVFSLQNEADLKGKTFEQAMLLANQYIDNANHDITDTLLYFYNSVLSSLAAQYGEEHLIKNHEVMSKAYAALNKSKRLVVESRGNISLREKNYKEVTILMTELGSLYPNIRNIEIVLDVDNLRKKSWKHSAMLSAVGVLIGCFITLILT
ncbi:MAG TPA: hypothetical protein DD827_01245 [Gammaproteobacteria bacterium]|nr:hypothetical protein [Gammaproteobacteria bacterium]